MNKVCAVGDVGRDLYVDLHIEKAGGCSLNFACHYKNVSPKSSVTLLSALGARSNNRPIYDCLEIFNIEEEFQFLDGETPSQPIRLHTTGEKIFFDYHAEVLTQFKLNKQQIAHLTKNDLIVTVLFRGFENLVSQVIQSKLHQKLAIDFMSMSDYKKNLSPILKFLELSDFAFFGLSIHDQVLISELKTLSKTLNKIIVITLGEKGSLALVKGVEFSAPIEKPVKMIDSTGAGDSFAAAFLAHYSRGISVSESLLLANAYAAKTVMHLGAIPRF